MPRQADVRFFFRLTEGPELEMVRFELTEGVSQPFRLALELASEDDAVDAATMLDREATLTIERAGGVERRVVGIVTAFEQGETGFRRTRYRAVVESPLARLALRHNSRIFQQVNATDIRVYLSDELRPEDSLTLRFASDDFHCCHSVSAASATEVSGAEEVVTDAITGRPLHHYYLRKTLPGPPDLGIVVVNADVRSSGEHVTVTTPSGDLDVMTCQSSEGIHLFLSRRAWMNRLLVTSRKVRGSLLPAVHRSAS